MLTASGNVCVQSPEGQYNTAFVQLGRHRATNRMRFAQAWHHTNEAGQILVSGNKTDGVDAFAKEIKREIGIDGILSKAHGKVFWLERHDATPDLIAQWLGFAELTPNKDGYFTAAGMFSSDHVDPGSRLLAAHLDLNLKGKIADLGAGWGFLSKEALAQNPRIEHIDLFEADFAALEAAKRNLTGAPVEYHWADATKIDGHDKSFDAVISNPPFHESRKSEPILGQQFILSAAKLLKRSGTFVMVANRQLPYEVTLNENFRSIVKVEETGLYKVIVARGPR